jgi:hypothetical protein
VYLSLASPNADHLILVDKIIDSIISGNTCLGLSSQSPLSTRGIIFSNSCPRNQVCNNNLSYVDIGISFYSPNGFLSELIVLVSKK